MFLCVYFSDYFFHIFSLKRLFYIVLLPPLLLQSFGGINFLKFMRIILSVAVHKIHPSVHILLLGVSSRCFKTVVTYRAL